jgi:hypothetical protein
MQQQKLIRAVKKQFETLLVKRPALIKMVAILERILVANSFNLAKCQGCELDQNNIAQLSDKIWQLLPPVNAMPSIRYELFSNSDALFKKYADYLSGDHNARGLYKEQTDNKQTDNAGTGLNESLRGDK